jgi:hypothetical protein
MGKVTYDGKRRTPVEKKAAFPPAVPLLMAALNATRSRNPMGMEGANSTQQEMLLQKSLLDWNERDPESAFNRLRYKLNFMDMVATDPNLQKFPPEQIAEAFNQIMEIAPRAARQPLFMRGLVSKYLEQGGLDPFDVVSNVLKAETDTFGMTTDKVKQQGTGIAPGMKYINDRHQVVQDQAGWANDAKGLATATANTGKGGGGFKANHPAGRGGDGLQ